MALFWSLVHSIPSLSISYPDLIKFHDFADNSHCAGGYGEASNEECNSDPTRHDHGFTDNSILSVVVAMWLGCCSEVSYQVYVVLYNGKGSCFWGTSGILVEH